MGSQKERGKAGIAELSDQANSKPIELGKTDIVIMNPPFTRFQRTSPTCKVKERTKRKLRVEARPQAMDFGPGCKYVNQAWVTT